LRSIAGDGRSQERSFREFRHADLKFIGSLALAKDAGEALERIVAEAIRFRDYST